MKLIEAIKSCEDAGFECAITAYDPSGRGLNDSATCLMVNVTCRVPVFHGKSRTSCMFSFEARNTLGVHTASVFPASLARAIALKEHKEAEYLADVSADQGSRKDA